MKRRIPTRPRMAPAAWAGAIALLMGAAAAPVCAQDAAPGAAQRPSWLLPELANARNEGSLTVYSSMNEQEGLPLWKMFEDATGVKVNYVRSSDSIILSRIAIENRARQRSWDLAVTTTVKSARRGTAAIRSAGGARPHSGGAGPQPPLVWRLRQLQHPCLQHQPGPKIRAAEELRRIPRPQAMGRQDCPRRHR